MNDAVPIRDHCHETRDVRIADDLLQVLVERRLSGFRNEWSLPVNLCGHHCSMQTSGQSEVPRLMSHLTLPCFESSSAARSVRAQRLVNRPVHRRWDPRRPSEPDHCTAQPVQLQTIAPRKVRMH